METGFPPGSSLRRKRIIFGLVVMLAGLFWLTRQPSIPITIVDGVYSNPCCQSISISHGAFFFGSNRIPFTLQNMKFGLEASPTQNITVDPKYKVEAIATDDSHRIYILFDADKRGFTLLGPSMREFHFRR